MSFKIISDYFLGCIWAITCFVPAKDSEPVSDTTPVTTEQRLFVRHRERQRGGWGVAGTRRGRGGEGK